MVFAAALLTSNLQVSAWLVAWNENSISTFERRAPKLTEVMPELYATSADGTITRRKEFTPALWQRVSTTAAKNKVRVLGMVSNFGVDDFEPGTMAAILKDPVKSKRAIKMLTDFTISDKLHGIDLDYESMPADLRQPYSQFVVALAKSLHKKKKVLSVTVHPKESEPGTWDGPKSQDWKAIGAAADTFRIMCYDSHWSGSEAGAIAPTDWVVRVARFAMTQMPASKVDIGVAWYGYDWRSKPARSLTFADLSRLPFRMDESSGELVQEDKVYFSGRAAFEQKVAALRTLGLKKVSAWYCGSEDPDVWRVIPAR